jgi:hypothetical protein
MTVLTTPSDMAKAAPLIQPQLCRILKSSNFEAEVIACAALLSMACAERPVMQWRAARSGVLPRLQQLLRHPEPSVVFHVVCPSLSLSASPFPTFLCLLFLIFEPCSRHLLPLAPPMFPPTTLLSHDDWWCKPHTPADTLPFGDHSQLLALECAVHLGSGRKVQ